MDSNKAVKPISKPGLGRIWQHFKRDIMSTMGAFKLKKVESQSPIKVDVELDGSKKSGTIAVISEPNRDRFSTLDSLEF